MTEARRHPMSWEIKEKGKLLNLFVSILICALFFALNSNESNSCNHFFPIESREKSATLEKRRGKKTFNYYPMLEMEKLPSYVVASAFNSSCTLFFFILKRTSHNCFSLFAYFFNWIIRSFRLLSISVYFYDFFLFYTFRRYTVCFKARYYIFFGVSWYIIHARSRCKHSILRYEPGSWFGHSIEHLTYPFHSMTFKSNEQLASVTVTFTSPSTVLWNRTSERWKLGYWEFISVK